MGPRDQKGRLGNVTTHIYIVLQLRMRATVPQLPHALLREIFFKLTLQKIIIIIVVKIGNVPISK